MLVVQVFEALIESISLSCGTTKNISVLACDVHFLFISRHLTSRVSQCFKDEAKASSGRPHLHGDLSPHVFLLTFLDFLIASHIQSQTMQRLTLFSNRVPHQTVVRDFQLNRPTCFLSAHQTHPTTKHIKFYGTVETSFFNTH